MQLKFHTHFTVPLGQTETSWIGRPFIKLAHIERARALGRISDLPLSVSLIKKKPS